MSRYERITYRDPDSGSQKTLILEEAKVRPFGPNQTPVLIGEQVDKEGCDLDHTHVIEVRLITKRTPMQMNFHYGWLEAC